MDPPYDKGFEKQLLSVLKDATFVDEDTLFVVEANLNTDFDYAGELGYTISREKKYKTNKHMFLYRNFE